MKFTLLGAAAVAAIALMTPAQAQEVIANPGRCAQFYPNANCTNLGPGNPYTDGGYYANGQYGSGQYSNREYGDYQGGWQNGYAYMRRGGWHDHHHHHHHH
jgi:hypothetical protein